MQGGFLAEQMGKLFFSVEKEKGREKGKRRGKGENHEKVDEMVCSLRCDCFDRGGRDMDGEGGP